MSVAQYCESKGRIPKTKRVCIVWKLPPGNGIEHWREWPEETLLFYISRSPDLRELRVQTGKTWLCHDVSRALEEMNELNSISRAPQRKAWVAGEHPTSTITQFQESILVTLCHVKWFKQLMELFEVIVSASKISKDLNPDESTKGTLRNVIDNKRMPQAPYPILFTLVSDESRPLAQFISPHDAHRLDVKTNSWYPGCRTAGVSLLSRIPSTTAPTPV
jgi:hypothetical protein